MKLSLSSVCSSCLCLEAQLGVSSSRTGRRCGGVRRQLMHVRTVYASWYMLPIRPIPRLVSMRLQGSKSSWFWSSATVKAVWWWSNGVGIIAQGMSMNRINIPTKITSYRGVVISIVGRFFRGLRVPFIHTILNPQAYSSWQHRNSKPKYNTLDSTFYRQVSKQSLI